VGELAAEVNQPTLSVDDSTPRSSIRRNAVAAASTSTLRGLLAFTAAVILTRALGPAGRGEYAFVTNTILIVTLLGGIGMSSAVVRSKAKLGRGVDDLFAVSAVLGMVAGITGALLAIVLFVSPRSVFSGIPVIDMLWIALFAGPMLVLSNWTAVAYLADRVTQLGLAVVAGSGLFLVAMIVTTQTHRLTPSLALCLWGTTSLLPIAVLARRRRLHMSRSLLPVGAELVRFSMRSGFALLALILTWRIDVFIVKGMRGLDELGKYTVAVAIAEILLQLLTSLRVALAPFQGLDRDRDLLVDRICHLTRLLTPLAVVVTLVAVLLAPPAVEHVFGTEFRDAAPAVAWLIPGIFALVAQGPMIDYLLTEGRVRGLTLAMGVGMVLNIGLDVILLRDHNFVAAALAATVAYLVSCVLVCVLFLKVTKRSGWDLVRLTPLDVRRVYASARRSPVG
jgi:O-antigen/teichoic acid export membrane protein